MCLQSLSDSQIQHYLDTLKRPELWEAIQTTRSLQAMLEPTTEGDPGLLRVPLFVKLVADVYDPQQPISSKADLLDKYIDRQLSFDKRDIDRRKELNEYKWAYKTAKLEPDWKKTRKNLTWLAWNLQANNQVEFLIEHLQPIWINSAQSKRHYRSIFGLIGLIFGLTVGLMSGMTIGGLNLGLLFGLFGGLSFGLFGGAKGFGVNVEIQPIQAIKIFMSTPSKQEIFNKLKQYLAGNFKYYLTGGLFSIIFITPISLLLGVSIDNAVIGIFFIPFCMFLLMFEEVNFELSQQLKIQLNPNQGIWNSFQNQMLTTIIIFLISIFTFKVFSLLQSWLVGLSIALMMGWNIGGGQACLQHLSLRIVLWQSGLPWNFARFLNYCVERRLLLRVGGSYRFLHRELLDHFAQSSR